MPQEKGEMPLVEKARVGLDLAEKAKESIDRSGTWEAVVGRIKWLMDTLSPVAGVRVSFLVCFLDLANSRSQLNPIAQIAYSVVSVIPQVHLFASLERKTYVYVYLDARNSQISINVTTVSERWSRTCTMRLILQATKRL